MSTRKKLSATERKKEICQAAREKFLEKGFNNTTMEDVINNTSMSKGGVYYYYKNTADILYDIMKEGNEYRKGIMKNYLKENSRKNWKEKFSEMIVDKMIDNNDFMPIYVMFLQEIKKDINLKNLYDKLKYEVTNDLDKIDEEVFRENRDLFMNEFIISFINSIILGAEILGDRDVFIKNKDVLLVMLRAYIEYYKKKNNK